MLLKSSWVFISDGTNVKWLQLFHLYGGFWRRSISDGGFIKGSAKVVEPPRLEYKGFRVKFSRKGSICKGLIIRTNYSLTRGGGNYLRFSSNSSILLKKRQEIKSKYIYGPGSKKIKRKRFLTIFSRVI